MELRRLASGHWKPLAVATVIVAVVASLMLAHGPPKLRLTARYVCLEGLSPLIWTLMLPLGASVNWRAVLHRRALIWIV